MRRAISWFGMLSHATRWAMQSVSWRAFGIVALCGLFLSEEPAVRSLDRHSEKRVDVAAKASSRLATSPLRFEANAGQWDSRVRFKTHGNGATVFITDDAMTITADAAAVTMKLVGARPASPIGESELGAKSNFFIGNDPTKWRTDVPNFGQVRAKGWTPGVDVVWHGGPDGLEYDLDVAAQTDASLIAFDVEGASVLSIAKGGSLEVATSAGVLVQKPPRVVQDGKELRTRYRLDGKWRVGFDIEGYDRTHAALIDPALVYSTYVGGSKADNGAYVIAVDSAGSAYISGWVQSTDYPIASAYQSSLNGSSDIVVTKLSSTGAVVYSTYLGGSSIENGSGIAVDSSGNAYVGGDTGSTNFPTKNAVQSTNAGGFTDAFVTELNANGNGLVFSTYLGGSNQDAVGSLAVDSSGNVYATGLTLSTNFPTSNAIQGSNGGNMDAFVTELSASGTSIVYSTYLGGKGDDQAYGIAVDGSGSAYVAGDTLSTNFPTVSAAQASNGGGSDAFVTKISSGGSSISYSTYLGGSATEDGYAIAVDSSSNAYVTGDTSSTNFPTSSPIQSSNAGGPDAFVTELSATGTVVYSTYLGGSTYDYGRGIAVDVAGNAYVVGGTFSTDFPTANPEQSSNAGSYDAFVTQINSSGSAISFSTYLGGSSSEQALCVALDSSNNTYVAGFTTSTNFPTVNAEQGTYAGAQDFFVAELNTGGPIALGISPSAANVAPKGSKTFAAYGGSGGYTYSFSTNASGGTINSSTGAYTAGTTPNVVDFVEVTDSSNNTATAKVTVGAGVSISPPNPTPAPKGSVSFSASGGSGTGFTWSFTTNASGGSINGSTGAYTAGATGSVTDVVHVADSLGNTANVNVNVGAGVSIAPASPSSPPNGTVSFSASGGSGTGFTWSITTNNSGGSINGGTGQYTAGGTGNALDTVSVKDSLGNTASVVVSVGAGVAISPAAPTTSPKGSVSFGASGGSGSGYTWSLLINNSGGSINASTGAYTAGAVGSVTDTVKVVDSLGNVGSAAVTISAGVSIAPASPSAPPKGAITFTASGGSGTGYAWSLSTNASGGNINASTGAYVAGVTPSVNDVVTVTDSLGNTSTTTVSVGAGITISPTLPSAAPNGAIAFSAVGGSGTGFAWSIATNNSGATINASTGAYVAGSTGKVADTVTVVDSLGNTASVNVSVGGGLAINPAAPSTPPKGSIAFAVTGGSGSGFTWSLKTNASGGAIDATSGAYTAGATPNVTDVVAITDSLNNTSSVNVTVTAGVSISPTSATLAPGATTTFAAAGGSGKGYTWSVVANASGANITSGGVYTAGATGGVTDTVQLVDSLGNSATAAVSVEAGAPPPPPSPSSSCGCRVAERSSSGGVAVSLLALIVVITRRARRRSGLRTRTLLRAERAITPRTVAGVSVIKSRSASVGELGRNRKRSGPSTTPR